LTKSGQHQHQQQQIVTAKNNQQQNNGNNNKPTGENTKISRDTAASGNNDSSRNANSIRQQQYKQQQKTAETIKLTADNDIRRYKTNVYCCHVGVVLLVNRTCHSCPKILRIIEQFLINDAADSQRNK